MRYYVMSGPNQGETGTMTEGVGEIRLPHPTLAGVHCRYKVNSMDAMIEQAGFEPGVQLRYAGDVVNRQPTRHE
ncbi:hypothetical protein N8I84_41690 (plasmid) [Streptomyces cynarae]|uniref:Uncharacterized protein n=1 Tax=Streptomyces cynarae TaxID=2981134 RepID=A0ABY6EI14_9ACTN|nr:hypothetical protein [Streptomyces cynarae]UXY24951.1 hypothetical protein N8I84_41690 [Streptomyces cynarae]